MNQLHTLHNATRRMGNKNTLVVETNLSADSQQSGTLGSKIIMSDDSNDLDYIAKRGEGIRTSYNRTREVVYEPMTAVKDIYLRGGEHTEPWHEEVGDLLARRYTLAGWSRNLFMTDWSMLKRICGDRHPIGVFLQDLEDQVMRGETQGSREFYVARIKSVWNSLRMTGVIPLNCMPEAGLPKIKVRRASPRPLSESQVMHLISNARMPEKEWFLIAALTGMRACEISMLSGSWLENHGGQWFLRIHGKGGTEILSPVHDKIRDLIQSKKTLGRLYDIDKNYLSRKACEEMRRLGVMTKNRKDPGGSRLSFHSFRHFYATEMLRKSGGNLIVAQRLLRHQSPIVTMRYADITNQEDRTAVNMMFTDVDWVELDEVKSVPMNPRYSNRGRPSVVKTENPPATVDGFPGGGKTI